MKNFLLVLLAAAMMACGWLEFTGLAMLGAFVPLLVLAGRYDGSARAFWRMAGWIALFIALWYGATVWWVWNNTPAGPFAAIFFAWIYTGGAFMLWFFVSKRAPRSLSRVVFVAAWMVGEWIYLTSQASFPWLAVGNGFAHDPWAVQWYEFTGAYGGTLWVLVSSLVIYECLVAPLMERHADGGGTIFGTPRGAAGGRRTGSPVRPWPPILVVVVPLAVSLAMWFTFSEGDRTATVTIVQPDIDPYTEKFTLPQSDQTANLSELASRAPADARFIVMPETAIDEDLVEGNMSASPSLAHLRGVVAGHSPGATLVVGAVTYRLYGAVRGSGTARGSDSTGWYDIHNSALAIAPDGRIDMHHKSRLVIGAEMMPTWWWVHALRLDRLVAEMGGVSGRLGVGTGHTVFTNRGAGDTPDTPDTSDTSNEPGNPDTSDTSNEPGNRPGGDKPDNRPVRAGAGICWESVYGEYFSRFAAGGAQLLTIITNDGWWRDTPGHRQHFDFARLRAIENRRSIARSANTGRSGFIDARGRVMRDGNGRPLTLEWAERGAITARVALGDRTTLFTRLGDWPCRLSLLVLGLGILYFVAYRVRRKNLLVK